MNNSREPSLLGRPVLTLRLIRACHPPCQEEVRTPVLQMRRLRFREAQQNAEGHTGSAAEPSKASNTEWSDSQSTCASPLGCPACSCCSAQVPHAKPMWAGPSALGGLVGPDLPISCLLTTRLLCKCLCPPLVSMHQPTLASAFATYASVVIM